MSKTSAVTCLMTAGAATLLLLVVVPGASAAATPPVVAVRHQLLTQFSGTGSASGRIVISVSNVSSQPLADVTLRLASPAGGRLTGEIQKDVDLAAGETRTLAGEFVLAVDALATQAPLEWLVVYTDGEGFAQQALVRSDATEQVTMDADVSNEDPSQESP